MVAEAIGASGRPHLVRAIPSKMMARTELAAGPRRSTLARNMTKSLAGIASPRGEEGGGG